jgi:phosphate transport system permease protein
VSQSIPFFRSVSPVDFFTGTVWSPTPEPGKFGVIPLIYGTVVITVGAGLIAVPLGLLSAIFLSEYAPNRLRNFLKPAMELLAGIPTVVYGYFGLFFVTPLLRHAIPEIQSSNALSGAIVVGIMILPLVSSLCEDAISAVPHALREGAYGLGATKMEVTTKIVVPGALSGIMASFILALSRALGETMAVTLAAGSNPVLTFNPAKAIETMTAYIVSTSKGDAGVGTVRYNSIFAVGITLFLFTMVMNLVAMRLVKKFRQVYS